ncbi:MAG: ADP/ATP-dependent (S)-NAD(P)H-hydrate dehydratase, partial [Pseudomonadota bacterium]
DADALTSFSEAPDTLFKLTQGAAVVLTPHVGEFRRLFPDLKVKLEESAARGPAYSRVDAAREAAARAGCALLLKGPDTIVAAPDGAASIVSAHYERACPWLATAGAGDVLAGMITGLTARGFSPEFAAETAAWLHQQAAISFGPGLIAEDLPEALPAIFRSIST